MSSGVEADIALDAAVIATLGLNRLLGGAAGLAGSGAQALAALAEGKAEARAEALAQAERYAAAVQAVIERNARIAALAQAQADRRPDGDPAVTLPAPLAVPELAGRTEHELLAWCEATDGALDEAERAVSSVLAADLAGRVFALPPGELHTDVSRPATTTETVGRDRPASPAERPGPSAPSPFSAPDADADADGRRRERVQSLARVLSRLPADTAEPDVRHVAEAARRLADAATGSAAEAALSEVRLRVQEAARRAGHRREELRRLAAEAEARAQAEAERRYVLEVATAAFTELGYEVDTGFETLSAEDGIIVLTREDRPDHAVKMRIDDSAAQLRAALVRTREPRSEEERRLDAEREEEWCEAFEAARSRLERSGVRSAVTWRIEPGDQALPVAPEARQTRARHDQQQRDHERRRARSREREAGA